ncbi:hypothetical protein GLOTRDRAFT_97722 [Gloeophyllum trabeum ATCC 11539]|uniref:Pentacotripeptide-repeat region of PRORP domain-containing protein n=1 Tax=Gloeophyllum trabeum (strain ATCC 11539 / FP-39264 / Madison 617) TaxID=670483 RepID=S7S433_GLOTA|nr:uncharacterized protein GLOTRDRAFT_97722 [Gloeophyllum trabeum ATCC 11539]EPQ60614.1 hypothetical protein GLOTRDRAFT_97722 [Gloeophyllum trabeum ATCC 11539]
MNDQATNSLERLYSSIHAGFSGPYPWLAATPESVSSERPVLMPTVGWTSFILAFLKCRKPELAEKLWNDMVELGIKPGVEMWTALLDGYGAIRALDETLVTWESMKAAKIKPDPMAYRAFISTLFHMRKPDQAMGRFREFEKSGQAKDAETSQILAVYNTALHGLLLNFKEEEARSLYERMKETGPTPDIVSYNTFLRFHARKGDMKSFADWLKALTDAGLVGDVFTWSTVLFALFKAGRKDGPQMVTNIMRVQNIEPNVATYTSIIDHAVRERDEATLKAAFDLLRWMEQQEPEVRPNQVTYTSILSGMYRDEWLDPAVREECRVYIMESMQRRKMQPNRVTYHILLKACLRNPGPEGLRQALSYYNEMGERKIHKDYDTWYIILQGLVRRGDWDVAQEMVNEIRRTGFTPSGGLLNLIHKVYARPTKVQKGGRRRPA